MFSRIKNRIDGSYFCYRRYTEEYSEEGTDLIRYVRRERHYDMLGFFRTLVRNYHTIPVDSDISFEEASKSQSFTCDTHEGSLIWHVDFRRSRLTGWRRYLSVYAFSDGSYFIEADCPNPKSVFEDLLRRRSLDS